MTKNESLKDLLKIPEKYKTVRDGYQISEEIINAELIMPIEIASKQNLEKPDAQLKFSPLLIENKLEHVFIPLFTDYDELPEYFTSIIVKTRDIADMIKDDSDEIFGVVINPFSEFTLSIPLDSFFSLFEE